MANQQTLNCKPVNGNGGNLGFEAKMWRAADKLRNNMDAAEYRHVVLGLIFLKYIPGIEAHKGRIDDIFIFGQESN